MSRVTVSAFHSAPSLPWQRPIGQNSYPIRSDCSQIRWDKMSGKNAPQRWRLRSSAVAEGPRDALVSIHVEKLAIDEWPSRTPKVLQRFQTTNVTFKLTQGHRQSCHSIANIWFPICLSFEILSLIFENLTTSRDHDHAHSRDSF